MKNKSNTKEICDLFFKKIKESGSEEVYECNCGTTRKKQKSSGYTNLMSHLREKHDDWEQLYNDFKKNNPKSIKGKSNFFIVNPKVLQLHSWLDWIVTDNLPISTVEKKTYRDYSNLEPISVDTFMKYLKLVEGRIDEQLKEELPNQFGLIIDGWTEGSTHYFGVFAAYTKDGKNYQRFLTMAPPIDETRFTAQTQADFIVDVVENVCRKKEDILYLVADNTNTNPATADLLGVPFIGCASHRFNIAVQKYLEGKQKIIANINQIMLLLSNLKKAGRLRQLTDLEPVSMNTTRWSSKYRMIERYFRLEEYIKKMDDDELNMLIPSGRELSDLKNIKKELAELNEITLKLQDPNISMLDVRLIFDIVIKAHPSMEYHLAKDARIVKHPQFESAICKILSKKPELLSDVEKQYVSPFLQRGEEIVDNENQSILERALALKRKSMDSDGCEKYCDLTCIPPTSNVCERLFSVSR